MESMNSFTFINKMLAHSDAGPGRVSLSASLPRELLDSNFQLFACYFRILYVNSSTKMISFWLGIKH